jgi:hypothetical protein
MRTHPLLLLYLFCAPSYGGVLPEVQRDALITHVLQNFWGRAKVASGEFVQPSSEAERNTIPVSKAIAYRSIDAGEISGLAMWCKLDWRPNYSSLTKSARSKGMNDKQVAFVSFLHGAAQGQVSSAMGNTPCSDEERITVNKMLNRNEKYNQFDTSK